MRIDILKKTKHISEKGRRWIFVILGIPLAIWLIFWGQEIGLTQEGDFANLLLIVVVLVSMLFTMTFYVCRIIWNYLKLSLNDRRFWALTSAFSPLDGSRVLIGYGDGSVRLWDGASGRLLRKLEGHTHVVVSAVFSPDGTYAVTASYDGTARLWHAHSGELHTILPHEGPVNAAIFSPGGRQVITVSDDCTARLWDAASGECLATFRGHSSRVVTAMFDADGARVVTASHDRTARIWRTFPTTQSLIDEAQRLLPILKAQDRPLQNGVSVVE